MIEPSKGSLLIASPFLKDMHFIRSVVLICEHSSLGSLGIVLNKPFPVMLNDLVPDLDNITLPVYIGGPTQSDRIHFLHQYPDLIGGGEEIMKGVYWGGNYANLAVQLAKNTINPNRIK
jgi:putative transcriptional regulator